MCRAADRSADRDKAGLPGVPSGGRSISSSWGATPGAVKETGPLEAAPSRAGAWRCRDRETPAAAAARSASAADCRWIPGGRRSSSAKPKLLLLSPSAATLSGYSAPHTPGPEIGSIRTSSAFSLTRPTSGMPFRPRPATVRAPRTEKIRDRNPPTKQGRRSRRDTNELRASSAQLRPIYLRTLQRVDFTVFNHVGGGSVLWRDQNRAARLTFSGRNGLLAFRVNGQ